MATAIPATILRCRGYVQAYLDATRQVGDIMVVTAALGIVSTDAFNLGATAFPDPADEPAYPWLWWGQMTLESTLAAGDDAWGLSAQRLEVDTKAMRRWKPDETLTWVFQTTQVAGAPVTIIVNSDTRVLIGT